MLYRSINKMFFFLFQTKKKHLEGTRYCYHLWHAVADENLRRPAWGYVLFGQLKTY